MRFVLENKTNEEELPSYWAYVRAFKDGANEDPADDAKLEFRWRKELKDSPGTFQFELEIDLTKPTSRTRWFAYEWFLNEDWYTYTGTLTTEYNKLDKGLNLTQYAEAVTDAGGDEYMDGNTSNYITDASALETMTGQVYPNVNEGLKEIEERVLKKAGFTWKDLGFTNWK